MIVKAIINSKVGKNKYKIRVPIFDKVKDASLGSSILSNAEVCSVVNSDIFLNNNDIVYVDYENNDRSKPVIIGCLSKNNRSNYSFDSLVVENSAKLSNNSKIGDITYKELSCLVGVNNNIQDQLNSLDNDFKKLEDFTKNIDSEKNSINSSIEDINKNLSKIDSNLSFINNLIDNSSSSKQDTFYGKYNDLVKNANKIDNFIGKTESTLSEKIENLHSRLIALQEYTPVSDSDLSETIYEESVNDESYSNYTYSSKFNDIINALRRKFPNGKYWNHSPRQGNTSYNGLNNQDSYTSTPCPKHGNCGSSTQTCNGYAPNGFETSWQCMGYANKCGYDVTGYDPEKSSEWKKTNDPNDLKKLKNGDIIRYKNDGHSIYVINVSGDTITYTDCNSDGHCKIRWDAKISKTDVKKTFTYIRISPSNLSNSRLIEH